MPPDAKLGDDELGDGELGDGELGDGELGDGELGDGELGDGEIDEMTVAVIAASRRSLEWFRRPVTVETKDTGRGWDPVTAADRAVEADLRAAITQRHPGDRVVGEEAGASGDPGAARTWWIDPIDGTRSFVTGNPLYGTLVGVRTAERALAGWMHVPAVGDTWVAAGGRGWATSEIGGEPSRRALSTSGTSRVAEAVVACTHPDMFTDPNEAAGFARVGRACRMVRYGGDCVNYGLVALGLIDAVVETGLAPYDIMALVPILQAAGAVVSTVDGDDALDGGFVVAAATEALHAQLIETLRG